MLILASGGGVDFGAFSFLCAEEGDDGESHRGETTTSKLDPGGNDPSVTSFTIRKIHGMLQSQNWIIKD